MHELDMTTADLADRAGVPFSTVRFFGFIAHQRETLERLSVALEWPSNHLPQLWDDGVQADRDQPGNDTCAPVVNRDR